MRLFQLAVIYLTAVASISASTSSPESLLDRVLSCPYYADVYARADKVGSHAVEALLEEVSCGRSLGSFSGMEHNDCDLRIGFHVASFAGVLRRTESELRTAFTGTRGQIQDQMKFTALLKQHAHEFSELFGSFVDGCFSRVSTS